ncbi:hypothetical protein ES703_71356 [subsurface metagenome]
MQMRYYHNIILNKPVIVRGVKTTDSLHDTCKFSYLWILMNYHVSSKNNIIVGRSVKLYAIHMKTTYAVKILKCIILDNNITC